MKILLALSTTLLLAACVRETRVPSASAPAQEPAPLPAGVLTRFDFERVPDGALPEGWQVAETQGAGTPASWSAAPAPGGGRAVRVETRNTGGTFNLLLAPREEPADLELSVRVRADSGEEDQGGGVVWRAQGPDDYYVARWNPLEDNLRVYKVVAGVRALLQSAETRADARAWHLLEVSMQDDRVTVALDGERLLDTRDGTFPAAGRVGLWTKADAGTWFDDLEVREPSWPDER